VFTPTETPGLEYPNENPWALAGWAPQQKAMTANPHANVNDFTFVFMGDDPFNQLPDSPRTGAGLNDVRRDLIVGEARKVRTDPVFLRQGVDDGMYFSLPSRTPFLMITNDGPVAYTACAAAEDRPKQASDLHGCRKTQRTCTV
jgi:hypothetical protein